jgi:hypothetical protein
MQAFISSVHRRHCFRVAAIVAWISGGEARSRVQRLVGVTDKMDVVRIACRVCSRSGSYRLARLAAKYGPEITLRDLTERFSYDCLWRVEARSKKGKSACGVYLPDLEHKRPPDLPPGMVKLRLVKGD